MIGRLLELVGWPRRIEIPREVDVQLRNVKLIDYDVQPLMVGGVAHGWTWYCRAHVRRAGRVLSTFTDMGTADNRRMAELRLVDALCARQERYDREMA